MKKLAFLIMIAIGIAMMPSCEELENALDLNDSTDLTESEIVEGLKKALEIGTDTATSMLSAVNGYYGDEAVRILLPDEVLAVKETIDNILNINNPLLNSVKDQINITKYFDTLSLAINRAAEDAAGEAGGVFKDAITEMSIEDGWDILNGINPAGKKSFNEFDSTAATKYFDAVTRPTLKSIYGAKIDVSLDKDLIAGKSANDAWNTLVTEYNKIANNSTISSAVNLLTDYTLNPLANESIGGHCTDMALDGLFFRVGNEERRIRRNPFQYVADIIKRVFGSLLDRDE